MASAPPYDPSIDYAALGLGPDTPDQNYLQAVQQPQAGPTDLLQQIQPQGSPTDLTQQTQPQAGNVLQQIPNPQVPNPQTPQLGQPQTVAQPAQQFQNGQMLPVAPPRQRLSLMDILGRVGDGIARAGGGTGVYQSQIEHNLAQQNLAISTGLSQQEKAQDLAQTGVATQQNANQITNSLANALKNVQDAGGDIATAAPALAQQLGIPLAQANAIVAQEKANPGFIKNLAAATETASGKATKALALDYKMGMGTDGKLHYYQAGADGQDHVVPNITPVPDLKYVDVGTGYQPVNPKTNQPAGKIIPKSGNPEAGDVNTGTVDAQGLPIFKPIGTGAADKHTAAVQAENDKSEKTAKGKVDAENKFQEARAGIENLDKQINSVLSDPHLADNLGLKGDINRHIPGSNAQGVQAKIDQAAGQTAQAVLGQLHSLSTNGSIGFRVSQKELDVLQSAVSTLGKTGQSYKQYVGNAQTARNIIAGMRTRLEASHARANPSASGFTVVEH